MPRPASPRGKEDEELDDEFADPPPLEADDQPAPTQSGPGQTAGSDPRTPPRMTPSILARTPASSNGVPVSAEEVRRRRLLKRVKPPRADKDQLNGRVPIFLIDAVRVYMDKYAITEVGEAMTELLEAGFHAVDPDVASDTYADRCVETGFYPDRQMAKERYASGESQ